MSNLTVGAVTQTTAELSFTPSRGSESYMITANPGGIETTSTNSTAVVLSGLSTGTEYNISVVAFGRNQTIGTLASNASGEVTVVTGV